MVPPGKRNLGMVFQSYALWPHMSVRDNVKFGLDVLQTPKPLADARLDEVLGECGTWPILTKRYPSELSGGQATTAWRWQDYWRPSHRFS